MNKYAKIIAITGPHAAALAKAYPNRLVINDVTNETLHHRLADIDNELNNYGRVTLLGQTFDIPAALAFHTFHIDTTDMDVRTYETFCPVFQGFYGTIFDESDSYLDCELNDEECFREHYPELAEVPWDYIENNFWECLNYRAARLAVAQAILDKVDTLFPDDFHMSTEWQELRSPREYNFNNDAIDCKITLDLKAVHRYLEEHRDEFQAYLTERYTSRSGFISSYPNTVGEWHEDTEGFTALDGHYLGAILNFVAHNEHSDPVLDLYHAANGHEAFSNACNPDTARLLADWKETQEN